MTAPWHSWVTIAVERQRPVGPIRLIRDVALGAPKGNSGDQPIMNQPVTFQVNGTFTLRPLSRPSVDTEHVTV
jgi:hypothetical protein